MKSQYFNEYVKDYEGKKKEAYIEMAYSKLPENMKKKFNQEYIRLMNKSEEPYLFQESYAFENWVDEKIAEAEKEFVEDLEKDKRGKLEVLYESMVSSSAVSDGTKYFAEMGDVWKPSDHDGFKLHVEGSEGYIPHFHLKGKSCYFKTDECRTCINIKDAKYFHHGVYMGVLNSKGKKILQKHLSAYHNDLNKNNNWNAVVFLWNSFNADDSKKHIDIKDTEMPDYTELPE